MQSSSERITEYAIATLDRANAMLSHGGRSNPKTVKATLEFMTTYLNRCKIYNPAVDAVFERVVHLAAESENAPFIRSAIVSQTKRVAALSFTHLRDAMFLSLNAGRSIVERAVTRMEEAKKKNSVEEAIFLTMTGMSEAERGKQRFIDPAFVQFMELVNTCLTAIEKNSKFEQLFQEILRFSLDLCKKFNRGFEMSLLNSKLHAHLTDIFSAEGLRMNQRDAITQSSDTISSIIHTKQVQTRIANETRDWKGAVDIMRSVRTLVANLRRAERTVKISDLCPVWELEAEVLFGAGNVPFHAFHAVMVAKRRIFELGVDDDNTAKTLASQAVLAVLCVPDTQLSTSDEGTDRLVQLSKTLQMIAPPTREGLLGDLERPGQTAAGGMATLLSFTFPFVRDLYNLLVSVPTIEVCQIAAPLLKKITEQSPQLARYAAALEAVAVRNMLGIMSRCFCAVGIDDFVRRCGGLFKADGSDFAARVEPLLLKESFGNQSKSVVDFGTRQIIFLPNVVAAENLIAFQSTFAAHVAEVTREAYAITTSSGAAVAASSSSSSSSAAAAAAKGTKAGKDEKQRAKDLMSKIDDARIRTLARHVICKQRVDNFQDRIVKLQAAEQKRRDDDMVARAEKEEAKRRTAKAKADEKNRKIIAEEEAHERRKWVVTQVNLKYKNAHVPAALASKADSEFLPEASHFLLKALRAADSSRKDDTKTMDYYERFAREVEIPLRKEWFKVQSEECAKMRELQSENLRKEQQRDFEAKKAMKDKLGRLLAQKERYERNLAAQFEKAKKAATSGKAEAQEADMVAMMAEREAMLAARK